MSNRKIWASVLTIILVSSLGIYLYSFFINGTEGTNDRSTAGDTQQNNSSDTRPHIEMEKDSEQAKNPPSPKENKYYIIYIEHGNGSGSSFVPLKLNPGFTNGTDFNVSISFDDNGNIINGEKIIVVRDFLISNENKEMIRKVAGKDDYEEALKEIEDRVEETKKNLEKEGLL
ncbi:hypothetical protein M3182_14890 [Mesobacillus maritimus]|uniref:hypothetical protein n=1 Tax=Mesobacillus maritimus TaxID=1643336 RepID=UPI00203BB2B3|nr:hypothetical protein [Mesobacillus maritimus]MCM3587022.1 hypothetical protein [Mesobacillus maritimus]MCM3670947.1 hypothetical protein [Mesobacillus maritimus]